MTSRETLVRVFYPWRWKASKDSSHSSRRFEEDKESFVSSGWELTEHPPMNLRKCQSRFPSFLSKPYLPSDSLVLESCPLKTSFCSFVNANFVRLYASQWNLFVSSDSDSKINIRLSEKCFSFTDTSFTTTHLYINMKPNLSVVVIFILIKQNWSYVIRQNNITRKMLCIHYFLIKRKKLFGRPNINVTLYEESNGFQLALLVFELNWSTLQFISIT